MITQLIGQAIDGGPEVFGAPEPGYYRCYIDSAGVIHTLDSNGTDVEYSGGSGGGVSFPGKQDAYTILGNDGMDALKWVGPATEDSVFGRLAGGDLGFIPLVHLFQVFGGGGAQPSIPTLEQVTQADNPNVLVDGTVIVWSEAAGKWSFLSTAELIAQLALRTLPAGGSVGQIPVIGADGSTLTWIDQPAGGTGPGGGTGPTGPAVLAGTFSAPTADRAVNFALLNDGLTNQSAVWGPQGNAAVLYDLGAGKTAVLSKVRIFPNDTYPQWSKMLQVQGSNDGASWTNLGQTADISDTTVWQETVINTQVAYRYFQLMNSHDFMGLAEVQFIGQ